MKIVYEERELERIEESYKIAKKNNGCYLFDPEDPDRIYNLSFKVSNPALAEYILISLLNNRMKDFNLGIDITSINLDTLENKQEIKEKLHNMIDNIIK